MTSVIPGITLMSYIQWPVVTVGKRGLEQKGTRAVHPTLLAGICAVVGEDPGD